MMKLYQSENKIFRNRIKSFIIPRRNVYFTIPNIIYCNPQEDDFKRWINWHPNDDYDTFFEGEDKEWYFGETHSGELFVRKIGKGTVLGPIQGVPDDDDIIRRW